MLIIFVAVSLYCLYFVYDVTKTQYESNEFVYEQNVGSVIDSALAHAKFLLDADLKTGPADDYHDIWVSIPRGKTISERLSWSKYVSVPTNLKNQKWFELPGPSPATVLRYRFKLIDTQPVEENLRSWDVRKMRKNKTSQLRARQPNTPVAWHENKWVKTDDISSVDVQGIKSLLNTFESGSKQNPVAPEKLSKIIDITDNNYTINEFSPQNSEPVQFDRIVTQTDTRWEHFDDTMRLGRYYEERGKHNYFLIEGASLFYNKFSGSTNVSVKLENEPVNPGNLFGWNEYKEFRKKSKLPWWHENMWKGVEALTGAGALLRRQPVKSNSETNSFVFNDSDRARFSEGQTITFNNWFSSLHAKARVKYRRDGGKDLGTIFTAERDAPDSLILTNISVKDKYRVTLVSGQNYKTPQTASISLSGVSGYKNLNFDINGFAVLEEGEPISGTYHPEGGFLEMLIKSPKKFSGLFSLEGAILEQPEFVVLRNLSDKPVSLKGWRFGYKLGERFFWSHPFSTSTYYKSGYGKVKEDLSPSIPARDTLILTPDINMFDNFAGGNKNGKWGNSSAERIPVIEIKSWGPKFKVKKARYGGINKEVLGTDGGPNWMDPAEGFPWESKWRLYIPGVDWSVTKSLLEGEVVIFDPDGHGKKYPPVPGIIINQRKRFLTIAVSGTRKRFRPTKDATLTFCGIPDTVKEFLLLASDGSVASLAKMPSRKLKRRKPLEQVILNKNNIYEREEFNWGKILKELNNRGKEFVKEPVVNDEKFNSKKEKYKYLKKCGFSIKSDWIYSDSLNLPFFEADIKPSKSIKYVSDRSKIIRCENRWLIRKTPENGLPAHMEVNPLSREIHLSGNKSVSVEEIIPDGIKLSKTPGISPAQYVGKTVVAGPCPSGGGIHIFGAPGFVEFEWKLKPHRKLRFENTKLTLYGRSANKWQSPATVSQWNNFTNFPVKITVEVWNFKKRVYELRADKKSFDSSDKLFLGKLNPENLKTGRLKMKITTHRTFSPRSSALWLGGVNIHPYAGNCYVNINTVSLKSLLSLCNSDTNSAINILKELNGKKFQSMKSLPELGNKTIGEDKFVIRSDLFDLCVEAQVINKKTGQVLSQKNKVFRLDRAPARLSGKEIRVR